MEPETNDRSPTASAMVGLELTLALAAIGLAWLIGHSPWIGMRWTEETVADQLSAMGLGVIAAAPILVVMLAAYRWPIGPLRSVREVTSRQLVPLFEGLSVAEKAAVSLAAGLGEELLFRGLGQAALIDWIGGPSGMWIGLLVASVVFGACHWLNRTYAVLATIMGVYFGLLLLWTGNLWTPILAHAVYDFVALLVLGSAENRIPEPAKSI